MVINKPEQWRTGQMIFNFLEWLHIEKKLPNTQSKRMADPFRLSDEQWDDFYEEFLQKIKDLDSAGDDGKILGGSDGESLGSDSPAISLIQQIWSLNAEQTHTMSYPDQKLIVGLVEDFVVRVKKRIKESCYKRDADITIRILQEEIGRVEP